MSVAGRLVDLIEWFLPRTMRWRLGRALYIRARGEHSNTEVQGEERFLQTWALAHLGVGEQFVAIDAGANVGSWAEPFLVSSQTRGRAVSLHAFEPAPASRQLLERRLERFSRSSIIFPQALGQQAGTAKLFLDGPTAGTNSLHASGTAASQPFVQVETTTLDSHLKRSQLPRVHLLKIDTEGNDFDVLAGAADSLALGLFDLVQFEYNYRWVFGRHFLRDVFELVGSRGYLVGRCFRSRLEFFSGWDPELERFFECNLIIMKKELVREHGFHVGKFNQDHVFY